jgi:hypothetical protein
LGENRSLASEAIDRWRRIPCVTVGAEVVCPQRVHVDQHDVAAAKRRLRSGPAAFSQQCRHDHQQDDPVPEHARERSRRRYVAEGSS